MTIAIGSDHGGFELKEIIKQELATLGIQAHDFGTHSVESCDYPDIARTVTGAITSGECESGILICGTGIGMSIAANKVHGIRAALCGEPYSARMAREHNNANVLCMGGRVVGAGLAVEILHAWLGGQFAGGRHAARVEKISRIETEEA
ncbi:MAG: ribose 5-phosphate isomerase B [Symbiobacteriia bacterium]